MKSYTDLGQSKVLSEILPLESADMFYNEKVDESYPKNIVDTKYPMIIREGQKHYLEEYGIPCWSLAALLDVLSDYTLKSSRFYGKVALWCQGISVEYDNSVDACVGMILKLHELNLL